jgi:HSP20 family protein
MQRLMGEMDRIFGDLAFSGSPWATSTSPSFEMSAWAPRVDIFERGEQLVLHADLPGVRNEDVRVNVDEGVLTISGERRHDHEHESQGVYQCERSYGSFQRAFRLPEGVESGNVQASFENGVLEVMMPIPKQRATKGRDVPIGTKSTRPGVSH